MHLDKGLYHQPLLKGGERVGKLVQQATNTNDCGVFMSCIGALYIMTLERDGLLCAIKPPNGINNPITKVELSLNCLPRTWGGLARQHMADSLLNCLWMKDDKFLAKHPSVKWS